jgi:CBS domain-containing protein
MTTADMKDMSQNFLRAATFTGYGASLYVGVGIPIPVVDLEVVRSTAVRDEDIVTPLVDYGVPNRDRPVIREVSYAELKSGAVEINGEEVKTSSLSSYRKAREIAGVLKDWIEAGTMELSLPARRLNPAKASHPMRDTAQTPRVRDIMDIHVVHISEDEEIRTAAKRLLRGETNHLPVLDQGGRVVGIVTTYDISKAVVKKDTGNLVKDIMTRRVIKTTPNEAVDVAAQKLEKNNISALPVVDDAGRLLGLLSAIDLGKLFGGRWGA